MNPKPKPDLFDRIQSVARVLLAPYIVGALFTGLVVLAYFGYGLAHASEGAAGQFVSLLVAGVAVAIGLPLLILLPGRSLPLRVLKSAGMLVMLTGGAAVGKAVWYALLQPALMSHRFNSAMSELSIQAVHERPLYLEGKLAGLHLVLDVRVKHDIRLNRYGLPALDVLNDPQLVMTKPRAASYAAPLSSSWRTQRSKDGKPLESMPGMQAARTGQPWPAADAVLPAGLYRSERDFWLVGVEIPYGDTTPCKSDEKNVAPRMLLLAGASGAAVQATIGTRFSLRDRLGYRYFHLESPPLQFRYDHASWMAALAQLSVESCGDRTERKRLAAAAAELERNETLLAEGSQRLRDEDNPLYKEICSDDLGPLRKRLAAGVPPYPLSAKLWECAIKRPNLEVFALLIPVMHSRAEESEQYCDMVRELNGRRLLDHLAKLVELKLPLVCEGERRNDWRGGVIPTDDSGGQIWNPPAEQTYRWLRLLWAAKVPLCEPWIGGNLLSSYIAHEPAPTVELLLEAGCDPHARPKRRGQDGPNESAPYSASVMWAFRRFTAGRYERLSAPIDTTRIVPISRRMGDATAAELNAVDPVSGNNFLLDYSQYLVTEPDLVRYLASRGARLDLVLAGLQLVEQQRIAREAHARSAEQGAAATTDCTA